MLHQAQLKLASVAAGAAAAAVLAAVLTPASNASAPVEAAVTALPPVPANGEMGFIFSTFSPAILPGSESNCPSGFNNTSEKNYLAMISASERDRLLKPENGKELEQRWKSAALGPDFTNICTNYDQFPERPLNKLVQNRQAYGLDLDAGGDADTCAHDSFTGPAGETGIDNQVERALGCGSGWRGPDGGPGEIKQVYDNYLRRGDYKIVLLIKGVDSLKRDDDVQVILASSDDLPVVDAKGGFVQDATFNVSSNPRWRNVMRGRIENGVLTTSATNILLDRKISIARSAWSRARRAQWDFTNGRLKINLLPDGTIKGILGGYQPVFNLIHLQANAGLGSAFTVNHDCAADYNTLIKLADGGRDPKTGQCTRVSSAWEIQGTRAFVVDQPGGSQVRASR